MINKLSTKTLRFYIPFVLSLALVAGCSSSSNMSTVQPDPEHLPVAIFGQESLNLDDFESQYAKSVGNRDIAASDSVPMYTEFLNRYVDFRLKVMYGQELGLNNDSTLNAEIETYRKQLARPYLLEKEILDPILKDLYEKKQNMVDASHILVRVGRSAGPDEVTAAYNKISALKDSVEMGMDFGEIALRNSEDPSAKGDRIGAKGRLGYFVGGMMVKDFEDQAYATPVDSLSEIFRSDFGYHFMKVHDRRIKEPDVYASHIAVRFIPTSSTDTLSSEERIQQIKMRLDAGEDFAEVALGSSEDLDSGSRGGQIGKLTFTQQGMPEEFKKALFGLENEGDYSDIIKTDYGYHIIKLDRRAGIETFEESYDELKNHASRLPRLKKAETDMALLIREKHGFSVDTTLTLEILDGRHFGVANILDTPAEQLNMEIASIGDASFTFKNVVDFAETASIPFQPDTLGLVLDAIDRFLNDEALNYEAGRLENRDPEFKSILNEFEDGLLLFKLMEDSVWTAAAQDTAGLMAYHAPRADSFWFEDRTRIISFRHVSDSLLANYTTKLNEGVALADVMDMIQMDTTSYVRIDTTYLARPNNSIYDRVFTKKAGELIGPIKNSGNFIVMINDGTEPARQKTFEEARSEVLNGYQAVLEKDLVDRLREKYKAKKYTHMLKGAFAEDKKAMMEKPQLMENTSSTLGSN
ncbi:MAG: peptidylprolyl isomerase [Rhodothermales bacterium]